MTNVMPIRPREDLDDTPPGKRGRADGPDEEAEDADMADNEDEEEQEPEAVVAAEVDPAPEAVDVPEKDQTEPLICEPHADERIPSQLNEPIKPPAQDVESHNITHLPYRNLCKICVEAKGREDAHRRGV